MPRTDGEGLGPGLERQLRAALDRVEPPHSEPRYGAAPVPASRWAGVPVVFAAAAAGLVIVTLVAAASTRAFDLQHHVVNAIAPAEPSATPQAANPSPSPTPVVVRQVPPATPKATPHAQPTESPEPGDDHSGSSPRPPGSPPPDE